MVLRVSAEASKEVRALISAMNLMDTNVAKEIRARVKSVSNPIVQESLRGNASTRIQVRGIVDTTRVKVSNQNVMVQAGATKGRFRNGLDARQAITSMEFGSNGGRETTYTRKSKNGGTHKVTRHTMRQFGPRVRKGKTFFPAVKDMAPRVVAFYIQTALRTIHETIERR